MRYFLIFVFVVSIFFLVYLIVCSPEIISPQIFLSQVSPGPNEALFYLSPSSGTFNGSFSVDLRINTSVPITSVKAYLSFPSSVISVNNIDTTDSVFGNWWENTFNNATGKIQLQSSAVSPGFQGSTGLIVRISFQIVSSGTANVTYDSTSLALKTDDTNVLNLTNSQSANFTMDSIPPTRSNSSPSGTLSSGTTQTTISLTTNESATCKYGTAAGTSYNSLPNTFTTTGGTSHSSTVTGLTNGSAYAYYVRCKDTAGNANTNDFTITFSVASSAFSISNITPLYLFRDKANNFTITGTSFSLSTTFYLRFVSGGANVSSITVQPQNNTTFVISLTQTQVNQIAVGFYDLKLERSTDSQSQTYSQKMLITVSGDISGSTPGARDGKVNIYDVSRLMSKWGSTAASDLTEYDINAGPGNISQGKIDLYDANLMMKNWTS